MTRHEWRGPALSATNLVAGYQQRRLRRSIVATKRLGAQPGELVAVVGPNGTGKSTLLRTLAGVLPPLLGRVDVNGRDMRRIDPRTRSRLVGVLLTDRFDAGLLRTREVIALGRHPATDDAGLLDQNDLAAAWQAAHQVGVANLWTAPFEQLSDGQRQRCLVARALAKEPAVAVLDEPTSHLDLPGRAMLTAALARLTRSRNTAVILSTHDLDHALAHADQLWLVTDGTVVPGAPEDLLANGSLAGAFARGGLTLDPTTATMRVPPRPGPTIAVRGEGLPAQLATRVAHRVGLRTLLDGIDHPADSTVEWELSTTTDGWILFCGRHEHHGTSYDELAHTLRDHLRPRPPDTTRN